jgi:hypothetical protein
LEEICVKFKQKSILLLRALSALWLAAASTAWAFDATKVPDGLYYNGTNVDEQLWTPLILARQGQLIDPFVFAQKNGVKALEGRGQTTMLYAVTPFLYGGCATQTRLLSNPPLTADVSTVYVTAFAGKDCPNHQETAFENYRLSRDQRGSNPFPTFYIDHFDPRLGMVWSYGVPGHLVGKRIPVNAYTESDIGAKPWPVNGVVSRMSFIPLPVIEPDLVDIALAEKKPLPKYPVSVLEAAHRSTDVVVAPELLRQAQAMVKDRLWDRYYPRLARVLQGKFGGIKKSYFELGLIQGVDLDNHTSFDYVGVARIGVVTEAGPWRWVDVIYCWRKKDDSFSVIATSENALYKDTNLFFSEKSPSLWAPSLVISGVSDFDKDKQLEVVASLIRPVANIVQVQGAPSSSPLDLRQNFLYAWEKTGTGPLTWREVYRTVEHEARFIWADPAKVRIDRFGQ